MRFTSRLVLVGTLIGLSLAARPAAALVRVDNKIHTGVFTVIGNQRVWVHVHHIAGRGAKCDVTVLVLRADTGEFAAAGMIEVGGGDANFLTYNETGSPTAVTRLRVVVELNALPSGQRNGNCVVSAAVSEAGSSRPLFMLGDAAQFAIVTSP